MTAANHDIIIEKNSDFVINVQVTEGIGTQKNISGYTPKLYLMKQVKVADVSQVYYVPSVPANASTAVAAIATGTVTDAVNGEFTVTIDKRITAALDTNLPEDIHSEFATIYTYFYYISIDNTPSNVTDTSTTDTLKVLRGRCAVRI